LAADFYDGLSRLREQSFPVTRRRTPQVELSIVTSIYKTASHLPEFCERSIKAAQSVASSCELILVIDGSPDNALDVARRLAEQDPRINVIDLSRNFGQHRALMTGLMYARGTLVFQLDSDLEEDPELVSCFYERMQEAKVDVVYGVQDRRKGGWFERTTGAVFYQLISLLCDTPYPENMLMARLMTRRYVDSLLLHQEREVDVGGLWFLTGYSQLPIVVRKHSKPETSYTLFRRFGLAVTSITAFSRKPLIMVAATGALILFVSVLYVFFLIFAFMLYGNVPSGFSTLAVSIWLLGGATIFSIGVVAIYISIIYLEVKNRPYTIVRELIDRREAAFGEAHVDD
jgi:putative glycosyltransferase